MNVLPAWQHGADGSGIKIGIVDSGIDLNNQELAGRIDPASRDVAGNRPMSDDRNHGTRVASVAAAARNGVSMIGIAPNATIIMMKADENGCDPTGGCAYPAAAKAKGIRLATDAGAKVINISLTGDYNSDVLDAVAYGAAKGVVFVLSAGNDGESDPSKFARELASAAGGQAIIAGALGNAAHNYNVMSDYSNRAGDYKHWYLGAPVYGLPAVIDRNGGLDAAAGTSFAAPAIAGAAALLRQAFPNLSASQIVQILLTTAEDLGAAGVDAVYGHGRINVGRAFQPIGSTAMASTGVTVSPIYNGQAPAAVGDALATAQMNAVVLDSYDRAFKLNLAATVREADQARPLEQALVGEASSFAGDIGTFGVALTVAGAERDGEWVKPLQLDSRNAKNARLIAFSALKQLRRAGSVAFGKSVSAVELERKLSGEPLPFMINNDLSMHFGIKPQKRSAVAARQEIGALGITIAAERGTAAKTAVGDPSAAYTFAKLKLQRRIGRAGVGLAGSRLDEQRTVLGGRFSSAFGTGRARTIFLDALASWDFASAWSIEGTARTGFTRFPGGDLRTSAFAGQLVRRQLFGPTDKLSVRLSQPLRVESGGFVLSLPVTYDYTSEAAQVGVSRVTLSPSARELIAEFGYERPVRKGHLSLNLFGRQHPGHAAGAAVDLGAAARLHMRF